MQRFDIEFYKTEGGDCPIQEFLDSLDYKMRAKVLRMILLLEQHGNELREPYSKLVCDEIFELRIKHGSGIARLMYFFIIGRKIVLTNGFIKKTLKTPKGEISKAKKYREDYIKRKEQRR